MSTPEVSDRYGHGTHVAGIAASKRFGVNPRLQIVPKMVSLTSTMDEFHTSVINRLRDISKDSSIRVVNLSLVSFEQPGVKDAVLELVKKGVWVVYAAGNSGQVNDDSARLLRELSNIPELFAAGALSYTGVPASFSNVGPNVRLFAPGAAIESLNHAYATKGSERPSILQSGTSMAAPYLAAVLTTLRAIQPDLDPREALLLLKETSIRRGTTRTIDQVNPVLAVEYLSAIRNARARGDCRLFESGLPFAKEEIEAQLKDLRRSVVAPLKGGCQEWKNVYDNARKGASSAESVGHRRLG